VTGLEAVSLPNEYLANGTLKMFMYHHLANYLADVLHTLHPPPITGLLESLSNTPLAARVASQSPAPEGQ
jgi:hypothetical protein